METPLNLLLSTFPPSPSSYNTNPHSTYFRSITGRAVVSEFKVITCVSIISQQWEVSILRYVNHLVWEVYEKVLIHLLISICWSNVWYGIPQIFKCSLNYIWIKLLKHSLKNDEDIFKKSLKIIKGYLWRYLNLIIKHIWNYIL